MIQIPNISFYFLIRVIIILYDDMVPSTLCLELFLLLNLTLLLHYKLPKYLYFSGFKLSYDLSSNVYEAQMSKRLHITTSYFLTLLSNSRIF